MIDPYYDEDGITIRDAVESGTIELDYDKADDKATELGYVDIVWDDLIAIVEAALGCHPDSGGPLRQRDPVTKLRVIEIHRAVWERFKGVAPTKDGEIDLTAIVVAVLEELKRHDYIDLERPAGVSP